MDFFGVGPWEVILILVVALLVIGPEKIPGIARTLGKTVRVIRRASSELTSAVSRELEAAEKTDKQPAPSRTVAVRPSAGEATPDAADVPVKSNPAGNPAEPGEASATK